MTFLLNPASSAAIVSALTRAVKVAGVFYAVDT